MASDRRTRPNLGTGVSGRNCRGKVNGLDSAADEFGARLSRGLAERAIQHQSEEFTRSHQRILDRAGRRVQLYRAERATQATEIDIEVIRMSDRYIHWLFELRDQYPTFADYKRSLS